MRCRHFQLHHFQLLARVLAVVNALVCSSLALGQKPPECAPVTADARSRVAHLVARKLGTDSTLPVIDAEKLVAGTCYREFAFSVPGSKRRWTVYLSPDMRFLSVGLWDVSVDPEVADQRVGAQLLEEARIDEAPARGPQSAPVTVVEFSDFQCPYCARFAAMVDRYQKENPQKIRLVFRNYPLPIHNWAMPAAHAGSCVLQQSAAGFWQLHDFLFSQQRSITEENLRSMIDSFIGKRGDLNGAEYRKCADSLPAEKLLARDLTEAQSYDIRSTPTVFINGRRYGMFRDDAGFAAAITASETTASKSVHQP